MCITAITAAVVMVFVSVMVEIVRYVRKNDDAALVRIIILPKLAEGNLPLTLKTMFEGIDGVRTVLRYSAMGGRHPSGATYVVVGEEEAALDYTQDFFPVTPEVMAAWRAERPTGAIVTETTARDLRLEVGQPAEITTAAGPLSVKVVGISRGGPVGQRIAIHFDYLQEVQGNPGLCNYRVFTKPDDFERVAQEIDERTKNSPTPVHAVSSSQLAVAEMKQAAMVPTILGFLGLFLIFTTALTLANNSAMSIRERRGETATMRVIGYHRRTILWLAIGQAVLIGLVGGLLAAAVTWTLFRNGVQLAPGEVAFLKPVKIGLPGIVAGLLAAVAIPFAGALPAAVKAARMPLATALRDA